jgi:RNA polymerase sigma-70 factor (ECF subfamily)
MRGEAVIEPAGARTSGSEAELERQFAALVHSHRERALRLAWRLLGGNDAAAEDVTQEAFVRAWRSLPGFRGEARLSTWLYRIVVRQAANHRRWRAVRERWGAAPPEDAPDPRPRAPGDPALRRRIAAALDGLSRGQREAFVLVHMEGLTVNEASEVLGKAPGTVKSHLHRALARLREELGDLREGPRGGDDDTRA